MTKAEVVSDIAKSTGVDKETTLAVVEAFMESVKDSLVRGENVYLRGFGSFIIKERAEKTARNISKKHDHIPKRRSLPSSPRSSSPPRSSSGSKAELIVNNHIIKSSYAKRKEKKAP